MADKLLMGRVLSPSHALESSPSKVAPKPRARRTLAQTLARAWAYVGYGLQMLPPMVLPIRPNRTARGEVTVGDHVIRCYRHWPDDQKLLAEWDQLSKDVPGSSPFQSPHWQHAVARLADSLGTLRLITVHRGDRLVGVLPLERKWRGHWHTPGVMTTDYHDPLIDPDDASATWQAILIALPKLARWPLRSVTMDLLSDGAACRSILPAIAEASGFRAIEDQTATGTTIPLAATWEEYLNSLIAHDRKEVRRKLRKAEERGRARFVVNNTQLSDSYALQGTFDLMERAGGGKGRKAKWMFRPHFETAAPALSADGRLTVYELYFHDTLAASLIALTQGGRQILWCGAIDRDLREWSPGIVLFAMVFRRAIELGQPSIDLLRGQYPYKYKMGAVDSPMRRMTLLKKS